MTERKSEEGKVTEHSSLPFSYLVKNVYKQAILGIPVS